MYPSSQECETAVKHLDKLVLDRYFKGGVARTLKGGTRGNRLELYSGGYSRVFPVEVGSKTLALRCWVADVGDARQRYQEIEKYLTVNPLQYFVEFAYVEKGFTARKKIFPIIRMEWVNGLSLKDFIEKYINNQKILLESASKFKIMVEDLHAKNISHGDLQDGNIILLTNKNTVDIKLIDYDSLFVPSLRGFPDQIVGLPSYQHPSRIQASRIKGQVAKANEHVDYFSELVIYLSILSFAEKPSLWKDFDVKNADGLLFTQKDFEKIQHSRIFKTLMTLSGNIQYLAARLADFCNKKSIYDLVPLEKIIVTPKDAATDQLIAAIQQGPIQQGKTPPVQNQPTADTGKARKELIQMIQDGASAKNSVNELTQMFRKSNSVSLYSQSQPASQPTNQAGIAQQSLHVVITNIFYFVISRIESIGRTIYRFLRRVFYLFSVALFIFFCLFAGVLYFIDKQQTTIPQGTPHSQLTSSSEPVAALAAIYSPLKETPPTGTVKVDGFAEYLLQMKEEIEHQSKEADERRREVDEFNRKLYIVANEEAALPEQISPKPINQPDVSQQNEEEIAKSIVVSAREGDMAPVGQIDEVLPSPPIEQFRPPDQGYPVIRDKPAAISQNAAGYQNEQQFEVPDQEEAFVSDVSEDEPATIREYDSGQFESVSEHKATSCEEILETVDRIYAEELNAAIFKKPIGEPTFLKTPDGSFYVVILTGREGSRINYEVQATIEGRKRSCPAIVNDE
jgi:serine/threonine protein kinase